MEHSPSRPASAGVSHHILPTAGTMVGVCTTLIGLVKVAERTIGPSQVDEYAGVNAVLFLLAAIASYLSLRAEALNRPRAGRVLERVADAFFLLGLVSITLLSVLFAYELV